MPAPLLAPLFASLAQSMASVVPAVTTSAAAASAAQAATATGMQGLLRGLIANGPRLMAGAPAMANPIPSGGSPPANPGAAPPVVAPPLPPGPPTITPPGASPSPGGNLPPNLKGMFEGLADTISDALSRLLKDGLRATNPLIGVNEGIGKAGEAVVKNLDDFAKATIKATNPMQNFGERIQQLTNNVLEAQRGNERYSDRASLSFTKLDLNRENRAIHRAAVNADSLDFATKGQDRLEKALQPLNEKVERITNFLYGTVANIAASAVEALDRVEAAVKLKSVEDIRKERERFDRDAEEGLKNQLNRLTRFDNPDYLDRTRPPLRYRDGR
jgi:hypothetical protein